MKHKEIFIYLLLFLVILFSFAIPKLVTNIEEKKMFSGTYVSDKKVQMLDKNEEKVDLINTIYSKYNNSQKYQVAVSDTNRKISESLEIKNNKITILDNSKILNKVEDLVNQNIIKDSFFKNLILEEEIIYRTWDYDNGEITYSKIKIFTNEDSFKTSIASIEVENITNKIIAFTLKKEYVSTDKNSLENYVKYLQLDIFDDWEYRNNECKTKEGGVKITTTKEKESVCVRVVPY